MHHCKVAAALLTSVSLIDGHGGGMHYTMDGIVHSGTYPSVLNTTTGSIQRLWSWDGFNSVSDSHLACGSPGTPCTISYHAPVTPGSIISINYTIPSSGWTFGHPIGPMLAYLAACPDSGCDSLDVKAKVWFKIYEAGLMSGNLVDGYWKMRDVFEGVNLDIKVPEGLRKGKYLLKHDMVNLQTGPPQWFPNCVQVEVSGTGAKLPADEELVAFPGGYDNDAGLSWPGPNDDGARWLYVTHASDTAYALPGPPVWQG